MCGPRRKHQSDRDDGLVGATFGQTWFRNAARSHSRDAGRSSPDQFFRFNNGRTRGAFHIGPGTGQVRAYFHRLSGRYRPDSVDTVPALVRFGSILAELGPKSGRNRLSCWPRPCRTSSGFGHILGATTALINVCPRLAGRSGRLRPDRARDAPSGFAKSSEVGAILNKAGQRGSPSLVGSRPHRGGGGLIRFNVWHVFPSLGDVDVCSTQCVVHISCLWLRRWSDKNSGIVNCQHSAWCERKGATALPVTLSGDELFAS